MSCSRYNTRTDRRLRPSLRHVVQPGRDTFKAITKFEADRARRGKIACPDNGIEQRPRREDLRDAHRGVDETELSDSVSLVYLDPRWGRLRVDIEKRAVRAEGAMDSIEGVDDARGKDSSKGPGQHRDVEHGLGQFHRSNVLDLEDQL